MAFCPRLFCRRLLSGWSLSVARMSTAPCDSIKNSSSGSSSPWLMLRPDATSSMNYNNFYSLAESRLIKIKGLTDLIIPDLRVKGSSHGWLALFNPRTLDLFLYNPISHRHINLPPIQDLPSFPKDSTKGVTKLILSCSPDEDEHNCRAVIIYNCMDTSAFCYPGQSKEWTPIGQPRFFDFAKGEMIGKGYTDFVYSTRQNLFFGLNNHCDLETWNLSDPSSPTMIKTTQREDKYYYEEEEAPKHSVSSGVRYLVVTPDKDDVLLVIRYVMDQVAPDGSYVEYYSWSPPSVRYPHMTVDFYIGVFDQEEGGDLKPLEEESLGDLALFIGCRSDSVALSATQFPELKPNSIYFTDPYTTFFDPGSRDDLFGGHDIGIFDYGNKTVAPCYYPCHVRSLKRIVPSPMWFFPRGRL